MANFIFRLKERRMLIMIEFKEIKDKSKYSPLFVFKNAPFTQAWFFGEWQEAMNRNVLRFEIKNDSDIIGFFQTIKYPMPFGQSFLYIPHGPILIDNINDFVNSEEFLDKFKKELSKIGKEERSVFIRFDPMPSFNDPGKYFKKVPEFTYHSSYFQPKLEWVLNLGKIEGELLKEMHQKTRYNINLAIKKDIKIEIIDQNYLNNFDNFYGLMEETAKRDDFNLHPKNYYENVFKTLDSSNSFLTIARHNDRILAMNLILIFGDTAYFLYGGSSNEYKNLMAPYLAHWEAIKEAKSRGLKFYNFGAISSLAPPEENNQNQFEGISRFKKGFGGKSLEYSDSYDLILKPSWYKLYHLYRFAKSIR